MTIPYQKQVAFRQSTTKNSSPTTLEQVIGLINQSPEKIEVLRAVLCCALAISQAEFGALLVVGNDAKKMVVAARQSMPDEVIEQLTKGPLGHLLQLGQWLRVEPEPLQLNPEQALLGRHDLKYLMGIPLQFNRHILGAIVVSARASVDGLREEERQQQLAALAQFTALFLDNARLQANVPDQSHEKVPMQPTEQPALEEGATDDLEDLLEAVMSAEQEVVDQNNDLGLLNTLSSEVGSTLNLNVILEIAVNQTKQALKAEVGWCYLFEDGTLTLRAQRGLSEKYVAGLQYLKPSDGVEGMAFSRNEPILRDGSLFHSGQTRNLFQEEGLHTVAAVPLVTQGKPFGVLALADRQARPWSPRDNRMLISMSRQVSQAIINSKQFTETKEKANNWAVNYSHLQKANQQLVNQVSALEQKIQALCQVEQQIWTLLAVSNQAGRQRREPNADEQLVTILKRALDKPKKMKIKP